MKNILVLIFSLISFVSSLNAQLVNIEAKRMQTDSVRFVLKSDLSTSYSDNNGKYILQIGARLNSQFKSKDLRKIYFLVGDYNLIRAKEQDFQNRWFAHARFNYQITEFTRFETFLQSQQNEILQVKSRHLAGAGVRFKLISKDNFRTYFGTAYMYEIERSDAFDVNFGNHRLSTYLSLTANTKDEKVLLRNTIYFQPLFKDFNDVTILDQFRLDFKITDIFAIFSQLDYYYDSVTPAGGDQFTFFSKFGISINIK